MKYFKQLGDKVLSNYFKTNFDHKSFPGLAVSAFNQIPDEGPTCTEVLEWVQTTNNIPNQEDLKATFGEPPITVYWHPRFYISVLFWSTGTTAIHQHGFSGAFKVLEGSSVHTSYSFAESHRINSNLHIGDVRFRSSRVLKIGDVHPIIGGDSFIHSLFHLDEPSATIVIRTQGDPGSEPQLTYYPPHLGFRSEDQHSIDAVAERRLQILDLISKVNPKAHLETAVRILQNSDSNIGIRVLRHMIFAEIASPELDQLVNIARDRHGSWFDLVVPSLQEAFRAAHVLEARTSIRDPDQRYLLALLASYLGREEILLHVGNRFPNADPISRILELVTKMSGVDNIGIEFDELNLDIFRLLVQGTPEGDLLNRLEEKYDGASIKEQEDKLAIHIEKIENSFIFSPLLRRK